MAFGDDTKPISAKTIMQAAASPKAARELRDLLNTLDDSREVTTVPAAKTGLISDGTGGNIVLAGVAEAMDGAIPVAGTQVYLRFQTDLKENGLWTVVTPGAWTRPTGWATGDDASKLRTVISGGTTLSGNVYVISNESLAGIVGTHNLVPVLSESPGTPTAGDGITKIANVFAADPDGTMLEISGGKIAIKALGVDTAQLAASAVETAKINDDAVDKDKIAADVAGNGLAQNVDGSLEVTVDASTIEINADTLRVKAVGILAAHLGTDSVETLKIKDLNVTTAKLNALAVTTAKIANDAVDKDKIAADVAGLGLTQNGDGSLQVAPDGTMLELVGDTIAIKASGVGTTEIADNAVDKDKVNADVAGVGIDQNVDGSLEIAAQGTGISGGGGSVIALDNYLEGVREITGAAESILTGMTMNTEDNTAYLVYGHVVAFNKTDATVFSYGIYGTFLRGAGTATLALKNNNNEHEYEEAGAPAATWAIGAGGTEGDIEMHVTGIALKEIHWRGKMWVTEIADLTP